MVTRRFMSLPIEKNTMKYVAKTVAIIAIIGLVGCSTISVDLSDTIYFSETTNKAANKTIAQVRIKNRVELGEVPTSLGGLSLLNTGSAFILVNRQPPLHTTVEEDIRRYFEQRLPIDFENSEHVIVVEIERAAAYREWKFIERLPLVGILSIDRDREIRMNFKVSISLQEVGKKLCFIRTMPPISIQGKATTQEKLTDSYKQLVAAYRKKIFAELDEQFIGKYLAK